MKPALRGFTLILFAVCFAFASRISTHAQNGKLTLHVTPQQAYLFVDGRAIGEASKHHTLSLTAGDHKLDVANYGYAPASRTVTITAGESTSLEVTLTAVSPVVSGPFGALTVEGANHDAVVLNGKTPDFFVGHGDEFNHEWWWKQELVVPPGNYQVSVLQSDKEIWSGPVTVPANQRVVIDIPKGVRKTVDWPRGQGFNSIPRFAVGTASATVAVAKPTAELSASAAQINCGDSSQLKWGSSDAPQVQITPLGQVAPSGEQAVQPKQTTDYQLTALGPGGTASAIATVNVNTAIQASLGLSPAEVQYKRVGDKVVQESNTALNWTAANASTVSIDPLGKVNASGSQTLQVTPRKTDPGPVDETITYTLSAANECGGANTQTATLHIIGSVEPPAELVMRSVYFPTDLPTVLDTQAGLVESQKDTLKSIAEAFNRFRASTPGARLSLAGHADRRGPKVYNEGLSERRVHLVEKFLIEQGVTADALDTQAYGEDKNLTVDEVKQLLDQASDLTGEQRQNVQARLHTLVLANNRRVDITLSPTGQESTRQYPYTAADFAKLIDRNGPKQAAGVELTANKEKITK